VSEFWDTPQEKEDKLQQLKKLVEAERRKVYIEVEGGIAHIISAPDDVDVYIIDLDEEKANAR
jgi:pentose-5-phosphate-3-epimerase